MADTAGRPPCGFEAGDLGFGVSSMGLEVILAAAIGSCQMPVPNGGEQGPQVVGQSPRGTVSAPFRPGRIAPTLESPPAAPLPAPAATRCATPARRRHSRGTRWTPIPQERPAEGSGSRLSAAPHPRALVRQVGLPFRKQPDSASGPKIAAPGRREDVDDGGLRTPRSENPVHFQVGRTSVFTGGVGSSEAVPQSACSQPRAPCETTPTSFLAPTSRFLTRQSQLCCDPARCNTDVSTCAGSWSPIHSQTARPHHELLTQRSALDSLESHRRPLRP